jgi:hypothetical protein
MVSAPAWTHLKLTQHARPRGNSDLEYYNVAKDLARTIHTEINQGGITEDTER